ncbi:hypothetical protein B0T11DRAFT_296675 [Plectosphaerella cucumerina]|uniref:Uncharacterized protein n=1 Tax=Plectosphaerella cucumerina TaxID=40658 RepID=A0A8K0X6Q4_9PEZI|nr:hypothetical protein B0T11DRAFT_296675 [Plectosphaerella cucumerina]
MEAIKASLSQNMVRRLHEVADGLLKVYQTLVRMQYLEDSWIDEGLHDVDALIPAYRRAGFTNSIIYLYSILPYVNDHGNSGIDMVFGGTFIDFRYGEDFEGVRNPMYANEGEDEDFLRPWMTTLSGIGNDRPAMIYDARRHVIGIFRLVDSGSWDLNIGVDDDDWEYPSDEEGSDDDELDQYNNWDEMDSRPAPAVLRDIALWYENLTVLPGGGELSGGGVWEPTFVKPLYIKHGWPHDFKAMDFLVDQVKSWEAQRASDDPKKGLLAKITRWRRLLQMKPPPPKDSPAPDESVADFWVCRWMEFRNEQARIDIPAMLQEAERAYEIPVDPQVRLLGHLRRGIHRWEKHLTGVGNAMRNDKPDSAQIRRAYTEKYLEVQKRAYEECKAELGGDAFFAERNMAEADLVEAVAPSPKPAEQERSRRYAGAIREWLVQVPEEAKLARELAEDMMVHHEARR